MDVTELLTVVGAAMVEVGAVLVGSFPLEEDVPFIVSAELLDPPPSALLVPPSIPPGIALATRLASNSTNTTFGFKSLTICPANSADDDEI